MKKVLIITYYWPPAGGPGVQRIMKFAKYLLNYDWQPHILTVKNGEFPALDENLVLEIPTGINIHKTFNPEPIIVYKKLTGKMINEPLPTYILNSDASDTFKDKLAKWIRSNLFIPDAKIGWKIPAVRKAMRVIRSHKIDLLFSSSPPQTVHLIARQLAKKSGLPWIADFRDPWTDAFWQKDMKRLKIPASLDRRLEQKVLQKASALVTVSQSLARLLHSKSTKPCHVIPNGYDEDDFKNTGKEPSDTFRIKYVGTLSRSQQITPFLKALAQLDRTMLSNVSIEFFGSIHSSIRDEIGKYHLEEKITCSAYIPHADMIREITNAEMLLLIIPDAPNNAGIVTGKLYEYLATGNFILGIGPVDGDAAAILKQTGCGEMYLYQADLYPCLKEKYQDWLAKKTQQVDRAEVEKYSRRFQTRQLADIFRQVLAT